MDCGRAEFQAIGTIWTIKTGRPVDESTWRNLLKLIFGRIEEFDKSYSRFRNDSLVASMSKLAGTYPLPSDGFKLLKFYEQLYEMTEGRVTPLIGQTMVEAGYDSNYSLTPTKLHRPPKWEDVLSYSEGSITVSQPALLDFGSAGKGYLVDIIGEMLEAKGIYEYLINAGGDMLHRSRARHHIEVGLENPLDTTEAIGIASISNQSLCASAGSKRTWGEFHHIIDPTVLCSPDQVVATWALADDAMTADGLATALFFKDGPSLEAEFDFSYALLYRDMSLIHTKDFPITTFEDTK